MRTSRLTPFSALVLSALLSACATAPNGGVDPGGDDPDGGGGGPADLRFDSDAFWAKDPPPMFCGLDGGFPAPKVPGGTPDCPDDKNREGCPCTVDGKDVAAGTSAPCWPGLRANRNLGICMDGTTTCIAGEVTNTWSRCEGFILPAEGASAGKEACQCFSAGRWKIDNLVPCFYAQAGQPTGSLGVTSSYIKGRDGMGNAITECNPAQNPLVKPAQSWSTNTVKVDCAGRFNLCYALKAGKASDPKPTDCEIVKVCTQGDYLQVDQEQMFPVLPAFLADSAAQKTCAQKFWATGGYGEMSVDGLSLTCDKVGPKVFNRVQYCPGDCKAGDPRAECMNCGAGGSGGF